MQSGFDAIFIHDDSHSSQVGRQHIRFVTRSIRIQQYALPIGNNAGRNFSPLTKSSFPPIPFSAPINALVTPTKYGNSSPSALQRARKFFDHGSFTGAADCEVSDANDEAPELALFQNSFPIKEKPKLHYRQVDERKETKNDS
jgi:hypothetical protein